MLLLLLLLLDDDAALTPVSATISRTGCSCLSLSPSSLLSPYDFATTRKTSTKRTPDV